MVAISGGTAATNARARIAALSRSREADDPELLDARRDLRTAQLEAHIRKVVDGAPPLTTEQRQRLALILAGTDRG